MGMLSLAKTCNTSIPLPDLSMGSGLLPPNCLFWGKENGVERLGIYVKPGLWGVRVQGQGRWDVPLPGFVFSGQGRMYRLYAVKLPPTSVAAVLYNFPAPNINTVSTVSGICTGKTPLPLASGQTIWDAVHGFFESDFNHHLAASKSQTHTDNIIPVWQALHEAEAERYPVADLVRAGQTLAAVIGGAK